MNPGLRCLPNEVWLDVFIFPWISRKQLGKIVHKLGDKDVPIVALLQYILHERGRRTLGEIRLDKVFFIFNIKIHPHKFRNQSFYKP